MMNNGSNGHNGEKESLDSLIKKFIDVLAYTKDYFNEQKGTDEYFLLSGIVSHGKSEVFQESKHYIEKSDISNMFNYSSELYSNMNSVLTEKDDQHKKSQLKIFLGGKEPSLSDYMIIIKHYERVIKSLPEHKNTIEGKSTDDRAADLIRTNYSNLKMIRDAIVDEANPNETKNGDEDQNNLLNQLLKEKDVDKAINLLPGLEGSLAKLVYVANKKVAINRTRKESIEGFLYAVKKFSSNYEHEVVRLLETNLDSSYKPETAKIILDVNYNMKKHDGRVYFPLVRFMKYTEPFAELIKYGKDCILQTPKGSSQALEEIALDTITTMTSIIMIDEDPFRAYSPLHPSSKENNAMGLMNELRRVYNRWMGFWNNNILMYHSINQSSRDRFKNQLAYLREDIFFKLEEDITGKRPVDCHKLSQR